MESEIMKEPLLGNLLSNITYIVCYLGFNCFPFNPAFSDTICVSPTHTLVGNMLSKYDFVVCYLSFHC